MIEIDLSRPVQIGELPQLVGRFFGWWGRELVSIFPKRIQSLFAAKQTRMTLELSENLTSWEIDYGPGVDQQKFETDGMIDALRGLSRSAKEKIDRYGIDVLIPTECALIRRTQMPNLSMAHLRQAINLQIDELMPFSPDRVTFDFRVVRRNPSERTCEIELAAIPRDHLHQAETHLAAANLRVGSIDLTGSDGGRAGFDFSSPLPVSLQRAKQLWTGVLAFVLAVSVLSLGAFWNWAEQREIAALESKVAEIRPKATEAKRLLTQIETAQAPVAALVESRQKPAVLKILETVTVTLPDTVTLFRLDYDGHALQISGTANDASQLVQVIEASNLFEQVRFQSSVTKAPGAVRERFDLAMLLTKSAAKSVR